LLFSGVLSPADIGALHAVARDAVRAASEGRDPALPSNLPTALTAIGAAFVTLRQHGDLRGCIGHIEAHEPLWKSVQEMATAAASRDSRFDPIAPEEVDSLDIEISVISPMIPAKPDEVVIGRDGLMIRFGARSGLLLPQVPVEHGWTRETFLQETCRKAGLPRDAWKEPAAQLLRFTAEII
jgi:AmmeMemoRadiSam system protein A